DFLESGEDVSEAGKIARRSFREGHAARAPAGARADAPGFEDGDRFFRSKAAQPRGSSEAGKAASDDGKVRRFGERTSAWPEIDLPRRGAPAGLGGAFAGWRCGHGSFRALGNLSLRVWRAMNYE